MRIPPSPSRAIRRSVLILSVLLGVAGCGSRDSRTVVRFLDQADNGGGWGELIRTFEARHPEIDVELVEGPAATNTRQTMYATSFLSGDDTYDLAYMDVIWVPLFASRGWLRPLDDLFLPAQRDSFLPGDIAGSIYEGKIYRVPMRSDAGVLFYRSDIVETVPETFEDLLASARGYQEPPGLWGFVFQGRQYEGLVCVFLEILWGVGGDVITPGGEVLLDQPEAIAALAWMCDLIGDVSPEAVTTYQEEEARHAFHEGHAVFLRSWPYVWTRSQEDGSPIRGKVGIAPMVHAPGRRSAATLGGWGFGIASTCKHPEAAWTFIRFATSPEGMKILNRRNGALPARRALYEDPELLSTHPHFPDLYEILLTARPRPVHAEYPRISDAIQVHVSAALVGKETPDEALRAAASEIRALLAP